MTDNQQMLFGDQPLLDKPAKIRPAGDQPPAPPKITQALPIDGVVPPAVPPVDGHGGRHGGSGEGPLKRMVESNFLQYASYVIRDRAIPDVEDGLKPVQRRILFSLHENDDGKFIKVANIVGYTMQYHPHGDASIGDALVTLANKQHLIEGQGNFGNIMTGDPAAASRYIECRLTELARRELFNDELTRFVPSYDGRRKEPVTLPAKLPLLLMLGADGIAVGLSTRIFPHNFAELIEAQIAVLNKKSFKLFPDFQQGGLMDASEYADGNGKIRLRAVIEKKDSDTLVIREICPGTTTDSLIASIEDATRRKKLATRSINDFTAEKVEIEVKVAQGQDLDRMIEALYAFTQCEVSLSGNLIVIRSGRPVEMTVTEVIKYNTERLVKLLKQELQIERGHLLDELHRKTLVQIFVENRIYKRIEECKTYPDVQKAVFTGVNEFRHLLRRDITNEDVEMLLQIQIKRISLFDLNQSRRDIDQIVLDLERVEKNLASLVPYAIKYLKGILKQYGDLYPRRTKSTRFDAIEIRELTARELKMVFDREKGYLGYGVEGDPMFECSSYDKVILVWDDGKYKVVPPPDKLFTDTHLIYAAVADRDRVFTIVYTHESITYMKRFTFGGTIQNKEYLCTPENAKVLLFCETEPAEIFVKYKPAKRQQIHQQIFHPSSTPVKGVKARGAQMTVKAIASISTRKPRNWDDSAGSPRGVMMEF